MSLSDNNINNISCFLLENLKRHGCCYCTYHQFDYWRHIRTKNVVTISTKTGIRPDAIPHFELVRGVIQDCPIVKYKTPPGMLFVSILPHDISYIDSSLIGGIFEVQQLPVKRINLTKDDCMLLWKKHEALSTPGSSFTSEFHNKMFGLGTIPLPRFYNSVLYTVDNADRSLSSWSMLNYDTDGQNFFFNIHKDN